MSAVFIPYREVFMNYAGIKEYDIANGRASAFPFSFPAAPTTAEAASIRIHGLFTTASPSRKKRKTTSSDNWGRTATRA